MPSFGTTLPTTVQDNITSVGTITSGTWNGTTIAIANGRPNSTTALNNNRIMVSSGGKIVESSALTNGQLLIGSTGSAPVVANLTAGSGISITNGAGSITIARIPRLAYISTAILGPITPTDGVSTTMFPGTGVGSLTIDANALNAGSMIKFNICGVITIGGTDASGTLNVLLGGLTVATGTGSNDIPNNSNIPFLVDGTIICFTAGSSGTVIGSAFITLSTNLSGTSQNLMGTTTTTTTTIDTTSAQTLDFQFTFGGSSTNTFTITHSWVTIDV